MDELLNVLYQAGPEATTQRTLSRPRLLKPERQQVETHVYCLDDLIPEDHTVRDIWLFVERLDLVFFDELICSIEGGAGRSAIDRRILLSLWLYALCEGISSGRRIDQLCRSDIAYKWLCGGVPVNYHTLDDLRSRYPEQIKNLLAQCLAVMMQENLIEPTRIAVDGTKIRARAKAARFHKEPTLESCLEAARAHVEALSREADDIDKRKQAARKRSVEERYQKCQQALDALQEIREGKRSQAARENAKSSITDPDARQMSFSDGGKRPGYNVQIATDLESGVIVAVAPTQAHDDSGGLMQIIPEVRRNLRQKPEVVVTDSGYPNFKQLDYMNRREIALVSSVKTEGPPSPSPGNQFLKDNSQLDRANASLVCPAGNEFRLTELKAQQPGSRQLLFIRKKTVCGDCPLARACCPDGKHTARATFQFRNERHEELRKQLHERTETEAGIALKKLRAQMELTNGIIKTRIGLTQFRLQGLHKVKSEIDLTALAFNFLRWKSLRAA